LSDAYSQALDQMRSYGLLIDEIRADSRYHQVKVEGNKGNKKSASYVCSEIRLDNGDVALVGAFWNYKLSDEKQVIKPDAKTLSAASRREMEQKLKLAKEAGDAEQARNRERAAKLAPQLWTWASPERGSMYLARKKVAGFGVRVNRHGQTLVPVRNWENQLVGLQLISPDGKDKKFLTGTPKQGAFFQFGSLEGNGPILIAEGYSTGASCHMAVKTAWPVFVAFDAGNLELVAKAVRERYPSRPILIAGDDDHADNKGRKKAGAAAKAIRAHLAFPRFRASKGNTDFNDLHVAEGLERVDEQLRQALLEEPNGGDPPTPPPPMGDGGDFDFSLGALLERYTLVTSTSTVYDGREYKLWELTALRIAATNKVVSRWQKHPERKNVRLEDVVFDPCGSNAPHQVNLFRGMPLKPKAGDCGQILELLHFLCGRDDSIYDWLLKWIAYPLQHIGAKMQSCVIMHGPEGTGKNLFWGIVAELYGEYAVSISQNQLDGRFNGWASAKLFAIGNEVVSRAELYHTKGALKTMITERTWLIEEKHLPARKEANHTNFALLSNVLQPVVPDPDDRHYMIVWTPDALESSFYTEVAAEMKAGGVEAFYAHLMALPMKGFNEHTKPIATEAKDRLIELSMDTPERFWRSWQAGDLKQPYLPAPSMVVYRIYFRWCETRGEKPLREAVFSAHMHRRMSKQRKRYYDSSKQMDRQQWFLIPHDWRPSSPEKTEVQIFTDCVESFRTDTSEPPNV
jgi:putative DNA primase/helicase